MIFNNYNHFKCYCLAICKNKEYNISDKDNYIINEFKNVYDVINFLINNYTLISKNDLLNTICDLFKKGNVIPVFKHMKYFNNKFEKFESGEVDFYYIISSLNTVFNLDIEYTEKYIFNSNNFKSKFYPNRIGCIEIIEDIERIYTVGEINDKYNNKYGVYFIYDNNNTISYIGKSTSCMQSRSLKSVQERGLRNFSKIELYECNSKSDVAFYEAYYIAKHKPRCNLDLIFDDEITVKIEDIKPCSTIVRNVENEYIDVKYSYYNVRVVSMENLFEMILSGKGFLNTSSKIRDLSNRNIFNKYDSLQNSYEKITKTESRYIK